jgi:hypothetical protein
MKKTVASQYPSNYQKRVDISQKTGKIEKGVCGKGKRVL